MVKIDCSYDELVKIQNLIPHPRNNNRHPEEQITRLSKIIEATAWRNPIIVSKKSGYIVVGHGRLEVAKKLGMEEVPVDYQDFENEAQEYQYLTSENAISRWSEIDLNAVKIDIEDLGLTDSDLDLFGLPSLDFGEEDEIDLEDAEDVDEKVNFIIKCESIADFTILKSFFDAANNKINFETFKEKCLGHLKDLHN